MAKLALISIKEEEEEDVEVDVAVVDLNGGLAVSPTQIVLTLALAKVAELGAIKMRKFAAYDSTETTNTNAELATLRDTIRFCLFVCLFV